MASLMASKSMSSITATSDVTFPSCADTPTFYSRARLSWIAPIVHSLSMKASNSYSWLNRSWINSLSVFNFAINLTCDQSLESRAPEGMFHTLICLSRLAVTKQLSDNVQIKLMSFKWLTEATVWRLAKFSDLLSILSCVYPATKRKSPSVLQSCESH